MAAAFLEATFGLSGKVALVTGASSGIGAHVAQTLAQAGCDVLLAARRVDKLKQVAAQVAEYGRAADCYALDVTQPQSVTGAVAAMQRQHGRIDILINNAGVAAPQKLVDMREQAWQQVLDTNLSGVWRVGQAVAKQMLTQPERGCIVNIASVLGRAVQSQQANYSAAKAGVLQLTRSMALELGRHGLRVNAIAPGYFVTAINQTFLESERGQTYLSTLFPGRAGKLPELDGALLLLTSQAGSYINGSVITVDGGALLRGF